MNNNFEIHNKSSENMKVVSDESVDLVFTGPPYNIGTKYGENNDKLSFEQYKQLLQNVFSECYRIIKPKGKLIIEIADSIFSNNQYIQLAGLVQSICTSFGFKIEDRHINFTNSKDGIELPEHDWDKTYIALKEAHSNCHQLLVFSKDQKTQFKHGGRILYVNYFFTPDHPCPTPKPLLNFILDNYYHNGDLVADPFMGVASIGQEVVKRGGKFIGYEIDTQVFLIAKDRLSFIK